MLTSYYIRKFYVSYRLVFRILEEKNSLLLHEITTPHHELEIR